MHNCHVMGHSLGVGFPPHRPSGKFSQRKLRRREGIQRPGLLNPFNVVTPYKQTSQWPSSRKCYRLREHREPLFPIPTILFPFSTAQPVPGSEPSKDKHCPAAKRRHGGNLARQKAMPERRPSCGIHVEFVVLQAVEFFENRKRCLIEGVVTDVYRHRRGKELSPTHMNAQRSMHILTLNVQPWCPWWQAQDDPRSPCVRFLSLSLDLSRSLDDSSIFDSIQQSF